MWDLEQVTSMLQASASAPCDEGAGLEDCEALTSCKPVTTIWPSSAVPGSLWFREHCRQKVVKAGGVPRGAQDGMILSSVST